MEKIFIFFSFFILLNQAIQSMSNERLYFKNLQPTTTNDEIYLHVLIAAGTAFQQGTTLTPEEIESAIQKLIEERNISTLTITNAFMTDEEIESQATKLDYLYKTGKQKYIDAIKALIHSLILTNPQNMFLILTAEARKNNDRPLTKTQELALRWFEKNKQNFERNEPAWFRIYTTLTEQYLKEPPAHQESYLQTLYFKNQILPTNTQP